MKRFLQRKNTRMYHVWLRSFMVCLCLALAGVSAWGETVEIRTADELYGFAEAVKTNPSLNAILMENIVVNEGVLKEDGQPQILPDDPEYNNKKLENGTTLIYQIQAQEELENIVELSTEIIRQYLDCICYLVLLLKHWKVV